MAERSANAGEARGDPRDPRGRARELSRTRAEGSVLLPGHQREYLRAVDPGFGFARIRVTLTIPQVPEEVRGVNFGEHVHGRRTVIGLRFGRIALSEDLGDSWRAIALEGADDADFVRCFTTASGFHLLQTAAREIGDPKGPLAPALYRYTPDWRLAGRCEVGHHNWHGRASIGEADGTIMWAEYPFNRLEHVPGRRNAALAARVWRSRDGGVSWDKVFEMPGKIIRHFHTVCADPDVPRQWWLSSGDQKHECRVWLSRDDGDSWIEATNPSPAATELHPQSRSAQAIQRFTDMAFTRDALIWGSDDWLGHAELEPDHAVPERKVGAHMFRSPRTTLLEPKSIGWIGNPVRSIVDIGPAWLVTTEAKRAVLPEPQILLVAKDRDLVRELFTIDVEGGGGTGFTYSRASARAEDGHFFSYRGTLDLGLYRTRLLHWHVELD